MARIHPVPAVLAVVRHHDQTLLVQRGQAPNKGRWGFPGGRIEPGETIRDAAVRELAEETGLTAQAGRILTTLDSIGRDARGELVHHYILVAVACHWQGGEAVAASDAAAVRWVPADDPESAGLDLIDQVPEVARLAAMLSR